MKYRINDLNRPIDSEVSFYEREISKRLGLSPDQFSWRRHRESIDARKGRKMRFNASVDVETDYKIKKDRRIVAVEEKAYDLAPIRSDARPVIVGAGPAGLFCAYVLAKRGVAPIVIERGDAVEERIGCVERFWSEGILDEESNVQFGEGGAGTFSDGKLTSRSKDPRGRFVLEAFARLAKDESILYKKKPHVGTDVLREVLVALRGELEDLGAEFHFRTRFEDFKREEDHYRIKTSGGIFDTPYLVLALGHSARDTFEILDKKGLAMEAKPFAVGFRIEQPQDAIDKNQYGEMADHLPPASYQATAKVGDRGVYSFCMCPGGRVVAAASEKGGVVTNGMSEKARDGKNANAAILVTVDGSIYGEGTLAGIRFQREIERKVFAMSGSYAAPVQSAASYLGREERGSVSPSYAPKTFHADLHGIYPDALDRALVAGLEKMGRYFPALLDRAILTAPETRSSSPVRLVREKDSLESVSHPDLYPAGEGAGYAGGIVSSAIDGMRIAEKIIAKEL